MDETASRCDSSILEAAIILLLSSEISKTIVVPLEQPQAIRF
jgi:hypothetical protein